MPHQRPYQVDHARRSVMATQHGFWIAVSDNRVFDGIVTRHLVARGNIIAIHAFYESDSCSFADIVSRLKLASPVVRVLFYTWAGRKLTGADMIGAVPTLDGMERHTGLLLKDAGGNDVLTITDADEQREFIALDPRVPKAGAWLSDRVHTVANRVRSDGVALDGAIRSPWFLHLINNPDAEPRYPEAFESMLAAVTARTPLTIFNNLAANASQEQLLEFAYGASIERFGLNDTIARQPTFDADILPYLDAIDRHHDRMFLVYGRASRNAEPYTTYDQDWRWQRYLYCAYLLVAGANTRWKQHAGFLTSPFGGRASGLEVYADALHELGSALGHYTVENGCYRRAFERGLVLVMPAESRLPITVWIGRSMYTPERAAVSELTIAPGEGHLLLNGLPARPPALSRTFSAKTNPLWRWSALRQESNAWHLHLDATSDSHLGEHDLALDLVRYRAPRGRATLLYRTIDASARVETVVEVDDEETTARFALIDGALPLGKEGQSRQGQFRGIAPRASQFFDLPVIAGGTPLAPDGQWHTLAMDLDGACRRSRRYGFRRALFMRLLGSLDVKRVRLDSRLVAATNP
jgi:hypothetical protein